MTKITIFGGAILERIAIINNEEFGEMAKHDFEIVRISEGLGFGHGNISGHHDEPEILARADEAIHSSGEILVPIDADENNKLIDSDGCGDGRGVKLIFRLKETLHRNFNRAKVFGGSAVMTAAAKIGVGEAEGKPLNDVFDESIDTLTEKGMSFGAHTDEYAAGENCGCGAIDKAPEAVKAAVDYEKEIREVIAALGADTEQLDAVYDNYRAYAAELPTQPSFSGRKVMERIVQAGKVVKQLAGGHREKRIILNTVRGYTVNQHLIREATGDKAQAFAVDIWRLEDIAANLYPDEPVRQSQAYLSELVYTLAISGVLTPGDLPVYMIQDSSHDGGQE